MTALGPASPETDRRHARGAAALLAFGLDLAPEVFFRATRGGAAESEARQLLLAVLRRALGAQVSIARLATALGRDRTTAAHALHKIEALAEEEPGLDAFLDAYAALTRELVRISGFTRAELDARAKEGGRR
ncbi:MAG: hypothetical protein SF051_11855 [Elusimicrobiota bacterium]|nr:hypothetical protein [Elusimicrobiota bacterium]